MNDKVDRADWGYVGLDPDLGFDARHNQRVVDEVIRETGITQKRKKREFERESKERTSAIASYVKSLVRDKSNTTPEQYFGKRHLAYLRGQEIIRRLKDAKAKQESEKANL